jgi:hypothetical protein
MQGRAVTVVTAVLLYVTACAAPVSVQRAAAAHKCRVEGTASLERNATSSSDGTSWTLVFSADTTARLDAAEITGSDGLKHHNLVALDCLVDTIVHGLHLCPGAWRHGDDDIATVLEDGRLVVRAYCISPGHAPKNISTAK